MPYRIDISSPPANALDVLVQLGALDVERSGKEIAAILPDSVRSDAVARALRLPGVKVSDAVARDNDSVWLLSPRAIRIGGLVIAPAEAASANALRLTDSTAFGTGHHPTTVSCIEAIEEILAGERVDSMLDVGTGSGILALAALRLGVPKAIGVDIDATALKVAAENARLNGLEDRFQLIPGGPDVMDGRWPLVVANVLAAPLIDMAPVLVRRLASRGRLVLSGIQSSLDSEVTQAYQHVGVRYIESRTRGGWSVLIAHAPW